MCRAPLLAPRLLDFELYPSVDYWPLPHMRSHARAVKAGAPAAEADLMSTGQGGGYGTAPHQAPGLPAQSWDPHQPADPYAQRIATPDQQPHQQPYQQQWPQNPTPWPTAAGQFCAPPGATTVTPPSPPTRRGSLLKVVGASLAVLVAVAFGLRLVSATVADERGRSSAAAEHRHVTAPDRIGTFTRSDDPATQARLGEIRQQYSGDAMTVDAVAVYRDGEQTAIIFGGTGAFSASSRGVTKAFSQFPGAPAHTRYPTSGGAYLGCAPFTVANTAASACFWADTGLMLGVVELNVDPQTAAELTNLAVPVAVT